MHWSETPIHIIDFEGTRKSGVLEFGIVTLLGGEIVQTQTQLCCAEGVVSALEAHQHGIDVKMVSGMPSFSEYLELFSGLRKQGVLGAHHVAVEEKLLKHYWPYPAQVPDFLEPGKFVSQWGAWVDTYQLYRGLYPDLKSHNIMDLVAIFGQQDLLAELAGKYCPQARSHAHCALFDALASALMLLYLGKEPGFEAMGLEWLLHQSAPSLAKKERIAQKGLF